ncbi:ATP-binding protein [Embleya sp. NPDC050493]|uniref:ATP-binding protein n=1 Tax=Embleya sp. NPDC050493 TaxID=3363989 RepID=UPI0037AE6497
MSVSLRVSVHLPTVIICRRQRPVLTHWEATMADCDKPPPPGSDADANAYFEQHRGRTIRDRRSGMIGTLAAMDHTTAIAHMAGGAPFRIDYEQLSLVEEPVRPRPECAEPDRSEIATDEVLACPSVLRLHGPRPVRMARHHVVPRCRAVRADEDDVALVVAELVANVFTHGHPAGPVVVSTDLDGDMFWVTVSARQAAVLLPDAVNDPYAESGRGLLLARALTSVFRCERRPGGQMAFVAGFAVPGGSAEVAPSSKLSSPRAD